MIFRNPPPRSGWAAALIVAGIMGLTRELTGQMQPDRCSAATARDIFGYARKKLMEPFRPGFAQAYAGAEFSRRPRSNPRKWRSVGQSGLLKGKPCPFACPEVAQFLRFSLVLLIAKQIPFFDVLPIKNIMGIVSFSFAIFPVSCCGSSSSNWPKFAPSDRSDHINQWAVLLTGQGEAERSFCTMNKPVRRPAWPARSVRMIARRPVRSTSRSIDARTIGRVRGAKDDPYTAGVICEKVRALRRAHSSPEQTDSSPSPRRRQGLRRVAAASAGTKPSTRSSRAGKRSKAEFGPEAIWPISTPAPWATCTATASSGCAMPAATRCQYDTICTGTAWPGFLAGTGMTRRPQSRGDGRERLHRHLGHQCGDHAGQRDDPRRPRPEGARGEDRRHRHLHATPPWNRPTWRWWCGPATDGALRRGGDARPACATTSPTAPTWPRFTDFSRRVRSASSVDPHARMGGRRSPA